MFREEIKDLAFNCLLDEVQRGFEELEFYHTNPSKALNDELGIYCGENLLDVERQVVQSYVYELGTTIWNDEDFLEDTGLTDDDCCDFDDALYDAADNRYKEIIEAIPGAKEIIIGALAVSQDYEDEQTGAKPETDDDGDYDYGF